MHSDFSLSARRRRASSRCAGESFANSSSRSVIVFHLTRPEREGHGTGFVGPENTVWEALKPLFTRPPP